MNERKVPADAEPCEASRHIGVVGFDTHVVRRPGDFNLRLFHIVARSPFARLDARVDVDRRLIPRRHYDRAVVRVNRNAAVGTQRNRFVDSFIGRGVGGCRDEN